MYDDKIKIERIYYKNGDETTSFDFIVESKINGFVCCHSCYNDRFFYINSDTIESILISEEE